RTFPHVPPAKERGASPASAVTMTSSATRPVPTAAGFVRPNPVLTSSRGIAFTGEPQADEFRFRLARHQRIPLALDVGNADVIASLFEFVSDQQGAKGHQLAGQGRQGDAAPPE